MDLDAHDQRVGHQGRCSLLDGFGIEIPQRTRQSLTVGVNQHLNALVADLGILFGRENEKKGKQRCDDNQQRGADEDEKPAFNGFHHGLSRRASYVCLSIYDIALGLG